MLRKADRKSVKLELPTKEEVKNMMSTYKSDIKLGSGLVFEDDNSFEDLAKFTLNSVYISDGFEVSQFKDKDKFFVRLTSTKNVNPKLSEGRYESHYIEFEFDTYEDFLIFCENVYTRTGITQTDGLHVEKVINSKSFITGAATATTVFGGLFLLNKIKKLINNK